MSLPIVPISILFILSTAIFLLSYYIFVIKCCLHQNSSDFLLHRLFSTSRRRRLPSAAAAEPAGLGAAAIRSIPSFRYSSTPFCSPAECSVCLSDFRSGELLRLLPDCSHAFHIDCIDAWLQSNSSCPVCRSRISNPFHAPADHHIGTRIQSVVIEVSEEVRRNQRRRLGHAISMGDECIEVRRDKDEIFAVQPLRRSLSLDSSCDPQLYVSVQETLRMNPNLVYGEESSNGGGGGGGSGRVRRPFFPFGQLGRTSRSAVQPLDIDVM